MNPQYPVYIISKGRWQHSVDYSSFRKNKPILKSGIKIDKGVNNYSMKLVKK